VIHRRKTPQYFGVFLRRHWTSLILMTSTYEELGYNTIYM